MIRQEWVNYIKNSLESGFTPLQVSRNLSVQSPEDAIETVEYVQKLLEAKKPVKYVKKSIPFWIRAGGILFLVLIVIIAVWLYLR